MATTEKAQNAPHRSLENTGTIGTIGTTSQAVDSIGVFGAPPGTDAPSGTDTPSGTTGPTVCYPVESSKVPPFQPGTGPVEIKGIGSTLSDDSMPDFGSGDPAYFASMPEFQSGTAPANAPPHHPVADNEGFVDVDDLDVINPLEPAVAAVAPPKHCNDCRNLDPCKAGYRFRFGVIPMEQRATPPCNGADFEPKEVRS